MITFKGLMFCLAGIFVGLHGQYIVAVILFVGAELTFIEAQLERLLERKR